MRRAQVLPGLAPGLIGMAILTALSAFLGACDREVREPGVVARVDGRPILLREIEGQHDLVLPAGHDTLDGAAARLREEYGGSLLDLVVRALVDRELEEQGETVTAEELDRAVAEVRRDYPDDSFDTVLVEEYVDSEAWREGLRARLAREKLEARVLRRMVRIEPGEAEAYYRAHVSDFHVPATVRFILCRGLSRDAVEKSASSCLDGRGPAWHDGVAVREMAMRRDRLPEKWLSALKDLVPGAKSRIIVDRSGFEFLCLLGTTPARPLDPAAIYPMVEKVLLEGKLREAFGAWLEARLSRARIEVSPHLLPDGRGGGDGGNGRK